MSGSGTTDLHIPGIVETMPAEKVRRAQIVVAAQADGDPTRCRELLDMLDLLPKEVS